MGIACAHDCSALGHPAIALPQWHIVALRPDRPVWKIEIPNRQKPALNPVFPAKFITSDPQPSRSAQRLGSSSRPTSEPQDNFSNTPIGPLRKPFLLDNSRELQPFVGESKQLVSLLDGSRVLRPVDAMRSLFLGNGQSVVQPAVCPSDETERALKFGRFRRQPFRAGILRHLSACAIIGGEFTSAGA